MKTSLRLYDNKIKTIIILSSLLIITVNSTCYKYQSGDTYPDLNSSYCAPIIKWPVSQQTFDTYQRRDNQALGNYTSLYEDYYQQGFVDLDCLGMAKYFFCAQAYPTCSDGNSSMIGMCSWMCDLFSVRCGQNNKFYQDICVNSVVKDSDCSYGYYVTGIGILIFLVFILLL